MGWLRKIVGTSGPQGTVPDRAWDAESGMGEVAWEFLTRTVWDEDKSKRETGTVLLFMDAGGLKVMLNDRDASRVAFVTVGAGENVLQVVEDALLSNSTDWRAAKKFAGPKK